MNPKKKRTARAPIERKARPSSRKRSTKRAENKERTRKEILRVALELFSKKGFLRTTTKEISHKAKIAGGTLFNYFKTKEDLALYFFEEELALLIEWYQANDALHKAPLPEKLFAIVYRHLERMSPYEEFIGAVYLRSFQPFSRLNPMRLETQERNLRYLRFVKEVINESEEEAGLLRRLGDLGAYAFGLFHFAILSYWLQDSSPGKERTLALLDRSLKVATPILTRRTWKW
ncbi:putative Transcriptional regulator [Verrucomicrobia bacterium]|nr:putative Transcriptional regulator [Verrucomicrobiota bacterium]